MPVGLFLSAGIDSSLVAQSAARSGRLARAFCLGFDDERYSEVAGASLVARRLGVPLTTVTLTGKVFDDFSGIVRHVDEPLADSSAVAVWTIAREASKHVKVVLSGDGGDELFGGYLTHRASLWHSRVTSGLPVPIRRGLRTVGGWLPTSESKVSTTYKLMRYLRAADLPASRAHFSWNGAWMPEQASAFLARGAAGSSAAGALEWMASRHGLADPVTLDGLQRADIGDYLPNDILVKSDRMSMAHGLEVRAPLLSESIAGFAMRLPAVHKAGLFGHGKRVLRELSRLRYGVDVAHARKQGFSVPMHAWLRGPARGIAEDLLSPQSIARVDPLDSGAVAAALRSHLKGERSYGFELWGLMVLVEWHRQNLQSVPQWPSSAPSPQRLALTHESARASAS
jgi:asparagine synthase (glutamine-hydrolysing)